MDPVICAQLILRRMKDWWVGRYSCLLYETIIPEETGMKTHTYEHASLPEGYFDDMIKFIIEESAKWLVTDYNAHCLVLFVTTKNNHLYGLRHHPPLM